MKAASEMVPLRRAVLVGALLSVLPALARPLRKASATSRRPLPKRVRGSATAAVRDRGAVGDGVHDDTDAFIAAIRALPSEGGTVDVAPGSYLIDAVRSVRLRSNMHLRLAPGARLLAKPNAVENAFVLFVDQVHDVEISGGEIIGERDRHLGTTGEWGHGIKVKGAQAVTIRDIRISKCWGDGITVGPRPMWKAPYRMSRDVVVANVTCTGNRRQGLSIGNVVGMQVYDSLFSDTHGTSPQCGIDIEPDKDFDGQGFCDQVHIENCVMRGNAAYGVNVWKRSRNVTITRCTIVGNRSCGIVTRGLRGGRIVGNVFRDNGSTGLFLQEGTVDCRVEGNTFQRNYARRGTKVRAAAFALQGLSPKVRTDLLVGSGHSQVAVGKNHFR